MVDGLAGACVRVHACVPVRARVCLSEQGLAASVPWELQGSAEGPSSWLLLQTGVQSRSRTRSWSKEAAAGKWSASWSWGHVYFPEKTGEFQLQKS